MRSAIFAAAFAASVIAVPLEKRAVDVVTNYQTDVVYVTDYYTVTGGAKPTTTAEASPAASPQKAWGGNHWGHNPWWGGNPNKGHGHAGTTTKVATWEPAPTKTATATWEPAPAHTSTASQAPAPSSGGGSSSSYSGIVINSHNIHRANHSASNIVWDQDLANTAQDIANSCSYEHNTEMNGGGYGQNIAAGVDGSGIDRIITNMFYDGEVNYYAGLYGEAQPDMSNFEHWGHFSQIVWKNTQKVGCYTKHCPGGLANTGSDVPPYFTVCNYSPPGNFANEYGDNVGRPLDHPSVTIN